MRTMTRAFACVIALCLATSAHAAPGAGVVGKVQAWLKNLRPRLGDKVEQLHLGLRARLGDLGENEAVALRPRVFHTADGQTRRVTKLFTVRHGKLEPEVTVTRVKDPTTGAREVSRSYPGNLRRAGARIGHEIAASYDEAMQHADFRNGLRGDKAAQARWKAYVAAKWAAEDAARDRAAAP